MDPEFDGIQKDVERIVVYISSVSLCLAGLYGEMGIEVHTTAACMRAAIIFIVTTFRSTGYKAYDMYYDDGWDQNGGVRQNTKAAP